MRFADNLRPLVLLLIAGMSGVGHGADIRIAVTACKPHKPTDAREYWSWREIDGKRCWYAGQPGKPKDELYWPRVSSRPVEREREVEAPPQTNAETPAPTPPIRILPVVPAGAEGSFEDRWLPVLSCGYHIAAVWDCRRPAPR